MEQLPLILAGPIVRRVEPDLASIWVAMSQPRAIRLSVWRGFISAGLGNDVFDGPAPDSISQGESLRVGEHLHLAQLVVAGTPLPFQSGQLFSYNLTFGPIDQDPFQASEDLKSLGLLQDRPEVKEDGKVKQHAHLALGYTPTFLPTFALPPAELTDVRILHGSCRRINEPNLKDGLAWVDDLIAANREDPVARPQQLFLTGDQIYADDVPWPLLPTLTAVGNRLLGAVEMLPTKWPLDPGTAGVRLWPADQRHFPARLRQRVSEIDGGLTSTAASSHLLSLGEYCAMYLLSWANSLWPEVLPGIEEVLAGPVTPQEPDIPRIWELHTEIPEPELAAKLPDFLKDKRESEGSIRSFEQQSGALLEVYKTLPQVRRALANIATYMIFDDHDVTDDWYLTGSWRDRVLSSPLGRTIVRNGLVAYTLFQAWGNDPIGFRIGTGRELIDQASRLFASGDGLPPAKAASDEVDRLLGLDGQDPPVKFHFSVSGPSYQVLVMDTRTRRAFVGRNTAPGLLSRAALLEQVPDGPLPAGVEVLVLVSASPILALPMIDDLFQPLASRISDAVNYEKIKNIPGTNPDVEAWSFNQLAFQEMLDRLAGFSRVVVLSGDIHFAHSGLLRYWKAQSQQPVRIAQFTSSGLMNAWNGSFMAFYRSLALAARILRLRDTVDVVGWDSDFPKPLVIPDGAEVAPAARAKLRRSPVLAPSQGWPAGSRMERPSDFAWRYHVLLDVRPDQDRPQAFRPAELSADFGEPNAIEGYRRLAARHAGMIGKQRHGRSTVFANNLGLVRFERQAGLLTAIHELRSVAPGGSNPLLGTLHRAPLDNPTPPEEADLRPTIGATP